MPRLVQFLGMLLFLTTHYCQAQNIHLTTNVSACFGGSDKEEFYGGSLLGDGGFLLTGLSYSKDGDIDPLAAYDTADIFIVRTNASGGKLWARTYGGNLYDKARFGIQDTDSNLVITGTTTSSDGDIDSTHGNSELFVLKTDPSGNILWFKNYGGTGYESGRFIMQTSDGGYLVTGYTTSHNYDVTMTRGRHDGWLLKLDVDGNIEWSQTYGGSDDDRIRCAKETADGGFVFAGSSKSNNYQCSGNHGEYDFWAGKVDSVGNLIWNGLYGGSQDDISLQVINAPSNSIIVTGYTKSGDGDVTGFHGSSDGWAICIDSTGNLIWEKCLGGSGTDRLYRAHLTTAGSIVLAGHSDSDDFDLNIAGTGFSSAFWLLSLDNTLNIEWSYVTGGSFGDFCNELVVNEQDSTYTLMGDTRSNNMHVSGNHGDFDFWLSRVSWISSSGINESANGFSGYYAATDGVLHIYAPNSTTVLITVNDIAGHSLTHEEVDLSAGLNYIRIKQPMASGIYAISLLNNGQRVFSLLAPMIR